MALAVTEPALHARRGVTVQISFGLLALSFLIWTLFIFMQFSNRFPNSKLKGNHAPEFPTDPPPGCGSVAGLIPVFLLPGQRAEARPGAGPAKARRGPGREPGREHRAATRPADGTQL